jgi:hypothetical protein
LCKQEASEEEIVNLRGIPRISNKIDKKKSSQVKFKNSKTEKTESFDSM